MSQPIHSDEVVVETSPRQRRWILTATCLALLAVMVSVSGLNVAQQALATDLGATQSQLLWIVNGFAVALAALLLPLGAVGDRLGRKPVLLAGVSAFAVLNVASAFASDPWVLVGLRVAMGVAAALVMPATLSTITAAFPPDERGSAVGVWTAVAGGGAVIGLITSALLIDNASWPWVFAAPVAISAIAVAITVWMVPNTREHSNGRFDIIGSILSVLAVGGVVLAIHEGPEQGWTSPVTLLAAVVGVGALVGFARHEMHTGHPLLDIRIFADRILSAGALALTVMFALLTGLFLVLIQFMQAVLEYSALRSSLALLPLVGVLMVISPISPRVVARIGYRTTLVTSLAIVAAGLGWIALVPDEPSYWNVLPALILLGIGFGIAMTPSTTAITESLPADKQGVASALNDTVRELGGAVGVALIGSVLASGYRSGISEQADALPADLGHAVEEGIGGAYAAAGQLGQERAQSLIEDAQHAFLGGWSHAMWLGAGIALAAAVAAAVILPRQRRSVDAVEVGAEDFALTA